ncbi:MAG: Z1 domain-containing protein [Flavobacteriales bacterium]|nr:Z1 domain-containing protein [Flavobacteriales bacterium]
MQLNAGPVLKDLELLFQEDFLGTTTVVRKNLRYKDPLIKDITSKDVRSELAAAITKTEVRAVHGQRNVRNLEHTNIQELNYEEYANTGLNVIAVGGNKLARGLTLEGLSVSYYLRTTRMYDSRMQMGRWFGYRPGYVDLCRLYTTSELQLWYEHVAMATDEMRADFDVMAAQNKTPEQFQIKVRKHPGMLVVTSAARMKGHETLQLSFSGRLKQTYGFSDDILVVERNYNALENCSLN